MNRNPLGSTAVNLPLVHVVPASVLRMLRAVRGPAVRASAVAAAALALTACTSVPTDPSGVAQPRLLSLGYTDASSNADGQSYGGDAFLAAVATASGGTLTATGVRHTGDAASLIARVTSGDLDGAWLPARDLESLGLGRFGVLSAPFTVTSQQAQAKVIEQVGPELLATLDGTGLTGTAVLAGALRRPVSSVQAFERLDTWTGVTVRALSPVQAESFRALGAVPVTSPRSLVEGVPQGLFLAAETDVPTQARAQETGAAPYLSPDVVLWSKMWVIVVGTERWLGLSDQERSWVVDAASAAERASIAGDHDEQRLVDELCAAGARLRAAGPESIAEMRSRVAPVIERLGASPEGPLLARITSAVGSLPAAPPLVVPQYCTSQASPVSAPGPVPSTRSGIPAGTYRMHLTATDLERALGPARARDAQVITLVIRADGSYTNASSFDEDGSYMVFEAGQVFGQGSAVYFVNDLDELKALRDRGESACVWTEPALGCVTNTAPYSVSWERRPDGSITFSDPRGLNPDPVIALTMTAHPFERVG